MIEIFETCQTKSIAKQTNRDESLIIRSILTIETIIISFFDCTDERGNAWLNLKVIDRNMIHSHKVLYVISTYADLALTVAGNGR